MKHLGNLVFGQIIDFKFPTHKADGTPITLAGTPVVKVYKGNATNTEVSTGVTLTVDFDGVTGLNHVRIDTSAAAFYAVGNDYSVVITTGTVDGISVVSTVLATFSIENRFIEPDIAAIKLKTDLLGTAAATVRAPVTQDGLRLDLNQGDDHTVAAGQAIEWTDTTDTWPDLTGATLTLSVQLKNSEAIEMEVEGTLVATTPHKRIRFEPPAALTALLSGEFERLQHRFAVTFKLTTGEIVTRLRGDATVWPRLD